MGVGLQGNIKSRASAGGVCNSGTWLRQHAPFQDLARQPPATGRNIRLQRHEGSNAKGSSMNAMLNTSRYTAIYPPKLEHCTSKQPLE
jgi:hypothetical protein